MKIKARVYCNGVMFTTDEINISPIQQQKINDYCYEGKLDIFRKKHIVPDVWRYTIIVSSGTIIKLSIVKAIELSEFNDRPAIDAIGTKIILLVLESPHTSEYIYSKNLRVLTPKAPAQGKTINDAGNAIEIHIEDALKTLNLNDGIYSLVICNPIPYMCSLGIFTGGLKNNLRNRVWKKIWEINEIRDDFINRISMYQPEYIINCCSGGQNKYSLRGSVSKIILQEGFNRNLYCGYHPARNWKNKRYGIYLYP